MAAEAALFEENVEFDLLIHWSTVSLSVMKTPCFLKFTIIRLTWILGIVYSNKYMITQFCARSHEPETIGMVWMGDSIVGHRGILNIIIRLNK